MDDRFNTIAGWTLFAGIVALGLSSLMMRVFHIDTPDEQGEYGYFVDAPEDAGGGAGEMSMAEALNMESVTASAGEKIWAKCTACHTIEQGGANGIGPNLYGIMGKPIGSSVAGFAYSSALAEKGGVWDWENMNAWLKSPRGFANGTKMSFAGLSSIEDRAAVSLFMNEAGSNLPVPDYVAEVVEEAEGEEAAAEDAGVEEEGAEAAAEQDAAAEENEGGA